MSSKEAKHTLRPLSDLDFHNYKMNVKQLIFIINYIIKNNSSIAQCNIKNYF